ncbi:MAG: hypothetical protein MI923_22670 [Phycisphaerales bacterium]|nr:hypothetical protein [Phycisphaerales bacterium]
MVMNRFAAAHHSQPKTDTLPGASAGPSPGVSSRKLTVSAAFFLVMTAASSARSQDKAPDLATVDAAMHGTAHRIPLKLWTPAGEPAEPVRTTDAVIRSRLIHAAPAVLSEMKQGQSFVMDLFDDLSVVGIVQQRRERSAERFTLSGRIGTAAGGSFLLAVNREAMAGTILMGELGTYRIRCHGPGLFVLQQIAPGKLLECMTEPDRFDAYSNKPAAGASRGNCDDGSVIDVLVVYTQAARIQAGGVPAMEAEIDLQVAFNNTAYANSLINTRLNLVFAWQLGPEHDDLRLDEMTDPNDGIADGIHTLRDAYGADQVALFVDGFAGVANGLRNLDPESEATAFCVNGLDVSPIVLAHEIGHNMGCCHALGQGGGCPNEGGLLFPFSNGHIGTGDSGNAFGTIMATVVLEHFSNPNVLFDGQPTGIPEGAMGHPGADNARTINLSAFTVSNWRCNDGICEGLALPSDAPDCDDNEVPDACDIAIGTSLDCNANSIPDGCEVGCVLLGDVKQDCIVDGEDIAGFVRVQLGLPPESGENQGCGALDITTFVTALLN